MNITLVAVSETSFSLEWEEPPGCSWNGVIIGYTLHIAIVAPLNQCVHFDDFVNMLQREISVPGTHANVGDLQPTTVYSIAVAAATSEGTGPFSAPVIVSTLESGTRVCVCACKLGVYAYVRVYTCVCECDVRTCVHV